MRHDWVQVGTQVGGGHDFFEILKRFTCVGFDSINAVVPLPQAQAETKQHVVVINKITLDSNPENQIPIQFQIITVNTGETYLKGQSHQIGDDEINIARYCQHAAILVFNPVLPPMTYATLQLARNNNSEKSFQTNFVFGAVTWANDIDASISSIYMQVPFYIDGLIHYTIGYYKDKKRRKVITKTSHFKGSLPFFEEETLVYRHNYDADSPFEQFSLYKKTIVEKQPLPEENENASIFLTKHKDAVYLVLQFDKKPDVEVITNNIIGVGGVTTEYITILGRRRIVHKQGRIKLVKYKGQLIKVSEAKSIEKKIKNKK